MKHRLSRTQTEIKVTDVKANKPKLQGCFALAESMQNYCGFIEYQFSPITEFYIFPRLAFGFSLTVSIICY